MTTADIRQKFLDFFVSKDHRVLTSALLNPESYGDTSTMLTSAGMQPLVPFFKGEARPPHHRLVTCQKVCRADDIEEVGRTWRHATFFEMLGNFSFGDYFKKGAIEWGWEFVTEVLEIPREVLWFSVYLDDDEAEGLWHKHIGVPMDRILRFGKKDNWWGPVGDAGPCGPDSEIFYDRGLEFGCGKPDCKPGCDCDRYGEIWNLVFQQYNQQKGGELIPLPAPGIDTGMGLERVAAIMQGQKTIFDGDAMKPIVDYIVQIAREQDPTCGINYGRDGETDVAIRIIADHSRALSFLAADGIMPSNEGRGYVMRRILRRAFRFGKGLGLTQPFLHRITPAIARTLADIYPELKSKEETIIRVVRTEEERFRETLHQGSDLLDEIILKVKTRGESVIAGSDVFRLYDTFGFPKELTAEIAAEQGLAIDDMGFEAAMEEQRAKARSSQALTDATGSMVPADLPPTIFRGYEECATETTIVEVLENAHGTWLILEATPFYAEAGGQVGDTGKITGAKVTARVVDTQREGNVVLHRVEGVDGTPAAGITVCAGVSGAHRDPTKRAHTATHLLHAALHKVLGDHATQAGSLVEPDRLRFDFAHFSAVKPEELIAIEDDLNQHILRNLPVETRVTSLEEARQMDAMALFGEKYGEQVRVVRIGDDTTVSLELCGGTHVSRTGDIGLCKIVSESSIGSNLRRIEALTGEAARRHLREVEHNLLTAAKQLNTSPDRLVESIERIQDSLKALQKQLDAVQQKSAASKVDDLVQSAQSINGIHLVTAALEGVDQDALRAMCDQITERLQPSIVLLASVKDGKVLLVSKATPDAVTGGAHVGNLVREVAKFTGGGGGGRPDFAQAGGKEVGKLDEAIGKVAEHLTAQLR
ncbi:MAG: alanine--tRNA ligase [Armatimonadetes bacterium]|nr:alanine--tRNA ligase [Armatimonadota bacterium]